MSEKPIQKDSFAKSLFLGSILEDVIASIEGSSTEERQTLDMVLESIQRFMSDKDELYREFDEKGEQSQAYIQELRELGLFSLIVPEQYEGLGLSTAGYSRVIEETSFFDASTSLTIGAHSSIGMKGLLLFGTEEQKQRYLSKLASGELIAAFCLTEPGSGSDAGSIKTKAERDGDGNWTINGSKIWITNGGLAGFYTVFASTDSSKGKLTAFIVERDTPGVTVGPKEDKLGIRASATNTVTFENVKIGATQVLGEVGKGFKVAMSILNSGRTGLGGGSVGAMRRCIELATAHAKERKQFGRPISEFRLVQGKLAQMTIDCFTTQSAVRVVSHLIDSGSQDYSVEAAMSKVYASEALWRVANEALQIAAGSGYMKEYAYERILRDSRINMIFEGTNEILRLYIALSGLKDAGEYLKDVRDSALNAFNDPIKGFGTLSEYVARKLSGITPIGRDKLDFAPDQLRSEAAVFEELTVKFGNAVEGVLKQYGKEVIGRQFVSARLAEISIDLFVGIATLGRVSEMLGKSESSVTDLKVEIDIVRAFTQQAKRRIESRLNLLNNNEYTLLESIAAKQIEKGSFTWSSL